MEYLRILKNKNKITVTTSDHRSYSETTANFSIRFVFSGNENCTIGRRQLSLHTDSFIMLNKGTQFTSSSDLRLPVNVLSIEFDEDFLNEFNGKFFKGKKGGLFDAEHAAYQLRETIYPLKADLKLNISRLKAFIEDENTDEVLINELLQRCLQNCCRIYNEEISLKAKKLNFLNVNTRIEILRRLNLAKEYLYANYDKNVSLESLANYACLSVNHLLRTFKLAYNQSPHQYLIQIRLQRAQLLLAKTEYPVYEIVNMVGFKCTSSFIRLFRNR
ncbi:MAG TPA: helix-turn-helix transcriptional regulator, partial [Mucilaginibacter sp.]|nr:helix-turn-helix transcriptional regulator [Mucilaginibacter sp.]